MDGYTSHIAILRRLTWVFTSSVRFFLRSTVQSDTELLMSELASFDLRLGKKHVWPIYKCAGAYHILQTFYSSLHSVYVGIRLECAARSDRQFLHDTFFEMEDESLTRSSLKRSYGRPSSYLVLRIAPLLKTGLVTVDYDPNCESAAPCWDFNVHRRGSLLWNIHS